MAEGFDGDGVGVEGYPGTVGKPGGGAEFGFGGQGIPAGQPGGAVAVHGTVEGHHGGGAPFVDPVVVDVFDEPCSAK